MESKEDQSTTQSNVYQEPVLMRQQSSVGSCEKRLFTPLNEVCATLGKIQDAHAVNSPKINWTLEESKPSISATLTKDSSPLECRADNTVASFKPYSDFQFKSDILRSKDMTQNPGLYTLPNSGSKLSIVDIDNSQEFWGDNLSQGNSNRDNSHSSAEQGRRLRASSKVDIKEVIEKQAISKWVHYLKKKMQVNESKETGLTPRDDTVWKKIFRDCREFYRILFKIRFHSLDYKTREMADSWTIQLLNELGVDTTNLTEYEIRKLFYYFHQTRLNSSNKYGSEHVEKEGEAYAVDIIEKYKDSMKALFLSDPVCSKLFYILYFNFDYTYFAYLKPKYKGIIDVIVNNIVKCLTGTHHKKDLRRLQSLIKLPLCYKQ